MIIIINLEKIIIIIKPRENDYTEWGWVRGNLIIYILSKVYLL